MRVKLSHVFVNDQVKALAFYTQILGFKPQAEPAAWDVPMVNGGFA